jgi:hypothetical protein
MLISLLLPLLALAADPPIGVQVTNVRESMLNCDCTRPENLGRVCIAATKYKVATVAPFPQQSTYGQTAFEAHIEGTDVVLTSKAYYEQCIFDETTIHFTEPEIQDLFRGQKYFGIQAVRGIDPWMQVALISATGDGAYSAPIQGSFAEEKLWSEPGTRYEAYRTEYPGTTVFRKPLFGFLTDVQIRIVLDGDPVKKYVKAWLSIQREKDQFTSFGEYTVQLRFFRKSGTVLKNIWDTSVIGIDIVPVVQ